MKERVVTVTLSVPDDTPINDIENYFFGIQGEWEQDWTINDVKVES